MSIEADECATRDMELLPALRAAELDYTLEWGSGDLYGAAADEIEHLRAALDAAPKPLDDPRLQGLFSDAISGALAFGAQNTNPPPAGHWLERFWQMGRAERELSEAAPAAGPVALTDEVLRYAMAAMGTGSPMDAEKFRLFWRYAHDAAMGQLK
jgi:hypothetical protein